MTTIAESFLNDLNDLEESSSDDGEQHGNEDFHQQDKVVVTEHLRSQQSFRTHMKRIDAALSVSFFLLCDLCVFRGETYILHYDTNLVHESFFFNEVSLNNPSFSYETNRRRFGRKTYFHVLSFCVQR